MKLFLTQPYLLSLHPATEMNVVWILSKPLDGMVEYGDTPELGKSLSAECYEIKGLRVPACDTGYGENPEDNVPISVWQYIVKIEGLHPGQKIYYRCLAGEEATQVYDFHTAPKAGEPFRIAQTSDLQGIAACESTIYKIGCMHPDVILYSGDVAYLTWRADQWFNLGEPWQDEVSAARAFFSCMQQQNGARLMQYAPTFLCPGNHEPNDFRYGMYKEFYMAEESWNWSVYMEMFRPLYPDPDTTNTGVRWYSADYGDMHLISLSINRWGWWHPSEYPGLRVYDSIEPGSPQITWLEEDLKKESKFKWVIQHFHILNKGSDVQEYLCEPVPAEDGTMTYPNDHGGRLMDLFEKGGVNAVTYGHSHVYERYYTKHAHYIEAAYLSCCYRKEGALPHPSGLLPIVEDNSRRSFLIVDRKEGGLFATGYYAEPEVEVFDEYQIADESGRTVPPV